MDINCNNSVKIPWSLISQIHTSSLCWIIRCHTPFFDLNFPIFTRLLLVFYSRKILSSQTKFRQRGILKYFIFGSEGTILSFFINYLFYFIWFLFTCYILFFIFLFYLIIHFIPFFKHFQFYTLLSISLLFSFLVFFMCPSPDCSFYPFVQVLCPFHNRDIFVCFLYLCRAIPGTPQP